MRKMKLYRWLPLLASIIGLQSCQTLFNTQVSSKSTLKLLDEYIIPNDAHFQGTLIGGLSGIDYDKEHQQYYSISDDRGSRGVPRYYTLKFDISDNKIKNFSVVAVDSLKMENGQLFPAYGIKGKENQVPDPESIRYNPKENIIVWSSEGERKGDVIENPSIYVAIMSGKTISQLPLPSQFVMDKKNFGPRRNGVFEGMSFSNDYKHLWVSTEEPLYQDSEAAKTIPGKYWSRIIKYSYPSGKILAQYAYPLDKVIQTPIPANAEAMNGISENYVLGNDKMLVLERSYAAGHSDLAVRIYLADFSNAENINNIASLKDYPLKRPATKKLLLDLSNLGIHIDNLEGICFGPKLPNGHQSVLLISDNNFSNDEVTQILLFDLDIKL
ncbi:Uncharacterized conserved protein [Riemerella columbipharyngis]|uniref:Uncharacterized conserved protein n=2 Tax=Riemerella columbipharyngis TaxID=1071918 RepID=A0A1G7BQS2_9FLAO|nr:Uncharacterized conserved protein [Riemerella columbipharyngis]